jgi:hypothetical protein
VSYILDALKKAERDRRRPRVPTLATMHAAPAERQRTWQWIVAGVVTVNVLVIVIVLTFRSSLPLSAAPAAPAAPVAATAGVGPAVSPPVSAHVAGAKPSAAHDQPSRIAPVPTAQSAAPPMPADASAARTSSRRDEPELLRPSPSRFPEGRLPDSLKLEVLIYSDHTAERVAYINGQRYVEGQRIDGRTIVEQIQRDGVLLAAGSKRYLLKQQ